MTDHRVIEQLFGLPPWTVRTVERRGNGDYAIVLDAGRIWRLVALGQITCAHVRWLRGRRVIRLSRKRIHGHQPRSPDARPRDRRARRRANQRRFAISIMCENPRAPLVDRALHDGDLGAVDELRAAIVRASHRGTAIQAQREVARMFGREAA